MKILSRIEQCSLNISDSMFWGSQFPQPTCSWKWVGGTNPQKRSNLTLEPNFAKNCIKPLVLGTSLASDTPKQPVSTAETSFCFILEPQLPHFCLPPVWDKIFLQFGTQFISPKLEEDTLAVIALWVMDKNSLCHQKISVYVKHNPNMCPTWCPQWEFSVKSGCEVQFGRF